MFGKVWSGTPREDPCLVFAGSAQDREAIAFFIFSAVLHELGHALGLTHDGHVCDPNAFEGAINRCSEAICDINNNCEYYRGNDFWGPVSTHDCMGLE